MQRRLELICFYYYCRCRQYSSGPAPLEALPLVSQNSYRKQFYVQRYATKFALQYNDQITV